MSSSGVNALAIALIEYKVEVAQQARSESWINVNPAKCTKVNHFLDVASLNLSLCYVTLFIVNYALSLILSAPCVLVTTVSTVIFLIASGFMVVNLRVTYKRKYKLNNAWVNFKKKVDIDNIRLISVKIKRLRVWMDLQEKLIRSPFLSKFNGSYQQSVCSDNALIEISHITDVMLSSNLGTKLDALERYTTALRKNPTKLRDLPKFKNTKLIRDEYWLDIIRKEGNVLKKISFRIYEKVASIFSNKTITNTSGALLFLSFYLLLTMDKSVLNAIYVLLIYLYIYVTFLGLESSNVASIRRYIDTLSTHQINSLIVHCVNEVTSMDDYFLVKYLVRQKKVFQDALSYELAEKIYRKSIINAEISEKL
jgi:hypothetical protein